MIQCMCNVINVSHLEVSELKKAYVNPEVKVISLNVEDITNVSLSGQDDITLSITGSELGSLFGSN